MTRQNNNFIPPYLFFLSFSILLTILTLSTPTQARLPLFFRSRNSESDDGDGETPEDSLVHIVIDSEEDVFMNVPTDDWASRSFPSRIVRSARIVSAPPRLKCFLWGERDFAIFEYGSDASSSNRFYGTIADEDEDLQAMRFITPAFTLRQNLSEPALSTGPFRSDGPSSQMPRRQQEKIQRLKEEGTYGLDLFFEEAICYRYTGLALILLELASSEKEIHTVDLFKRDGRVGRKIFSLDSSQGTGENVVKAALLEVPHPDVRCTLLTKDQESYRLDKPVVQPIGDVDYLNCVQYTNK